METKTKTNMEYLRDYIEGNDEAIEFWDAVCNEIEEKDDKILELQKEVHEKYNEIHQLEDALTEAEQETIEELEVIDCGIGEIRYQQPDNLKLQILMDEFKESTEANF